MSVCVMYLLDSHATVALLFASLFNAFQCCVRSDDICIFQCLDQAALLLFLALLKNSIATTSFSVLQALSYAVFNLTVSYYT